MNLVLFFRWKSEELPQPFENFLLKFIVDSVLYNVEEANIQASTSNWSYDILVGGFIQEAR